MLAKTTKEYEELKSLASPLQHPGHHSVWKGPALQPFANFCDEFTVTSNSLILQKTKILVPGSLQEQIVELAHQGIVKTKKLLCERVWFPRMNTLVNSLVKECTACQAANSTSHQDPTMISGPPDEVWKEL